MINDTTTRSASPHRPAGTARPRLRMTWALEPRPGRRVALVAGWGPDDAAGAVGEPTSSSPAAA